MASTIHPYLTEPDTIVLQDLFAHIDRATTKKDNANQTSHDDQATVERLNAINDPASDQFEPTVFVTWDDKDIHPLLKQYFIKPYTRIATQIVRHPTDVVFFTHILLYLFVNLPSAVLLFRHFTYLHGIAHVAFTFWCTGSFTLLMHNHIHNNGVLSKNWYWLDATFPYITEPLMGHTWDSYYYHHVKHHHVEGNGPDDLSSTIRYQRDNVFHFLHYLGRFLFFVWLELPLYFLRKNKPALALRAGLSELASFAFMYYMTAHVDARAATFTLLIPFTLLRIGLMVGNWGQHALVDEVEPDSDFRSSITLIDVPSNRFCFNDGYHTAHHLNPRRHWRDQPAHFLAALPAYRAGRALVFHNIDYLMLTVTLLRRDYARLAACLVPINDQQIAMSLPERADMLRTKTRAFSEADIRAKFPQRPARARPAGSVWSRWVSRLRNWSGTVNVAPTRVETDLVTPKVQ